MQLSLDSALLPRKWASQWGQGCGRESKPQSQWCRSIDTSPGGSADALRRSALGQGAWILARTTSLRRTQATYVHPSDDAISSHSDLSLLLVAPTLLQQIVGQLLTIRRRINASAQPCEAPKCRSVRVIVGASERAVWSCTWPMMSKVAPTYRGLWMILPEVVFLRFLSEFPSRADRKRSPSIKIRTYTTLAAE